MHSAAMSKLALKLTPPITNCVYKAPKKEKIAAYQSRDVGPRGPLVGNSSLGEACLIYMAISSDWKLKGLMQENSTSMSWYISSRVELFAFRTACAQWLE